MKEVKKKHIAGIVILIVLAVLAALLLYYRSAVKMTFKNLTAMKLSMDESTSWG